MPGASLGTGGRDGRIDRYRFAFEHWQAEGHNPERLFRVRLRLGLEAGERPPVVVIRYLTSRDEVDRLIDDCLRSDGLRAILSVTEYKSYG